MRILSSLLALLEVARSLADKLRAPDKWKKQVECDAEETRHVNELSKQEWKKLYDRYSRKS